MKNFQGQTTFNIEPKQVLVLVSQIIFGIWGVIFFQVSSWRSPWGNRVWCVFQPQPWQDQVRCYPMFLSMSKHCCFSFLFISRPQQASLDVGTILCLKSTLLQLKEQFPSKLLMAATLTEKVHLLSRQLLVWNMGFDDWTWLGFRFQVDDWIILSF